MESTPCSRERRALEGTPDRSLPGQWGRRLQPGPLHPRHPDGVGGGVAHLRVRHGRIHLPLCRSRHHLPGVRNQRRGRGHLPPRHLLREPPHVPGQPQPQGAHLPQHHPARVLHGFLPARRPASAAWGGSCCPGSPAATWPWGTPITTAGNWWRRGSRRQRRGCSPSTPPWTSWTGSRRTGSSAGASRTARPTCSSWEGWPPTSGWRT